MTQQQPDLDAVARAILDPVAAPDQRTRSIPDAAMGAGRCPRGGKAGKVPGNGWR